jgi:kynurenine formamidase
MGLNYLSSRIQKLIFTIFNYYLNFYYKILIFKTNFNNKYRSNIHYDFISPYPAIEIYDYFKDITNITQIITPLVEHK